MLCDAYYKDIKATLRKASFDSKYIIYIFHIFYIALLQPTIHHYKPYTLYIYTSISGLLEAELEDWKDARMVRLVAVDQVEWFVWLKSAR